jgi:hypothetical protein
MQAPEIPLATAFLAAMGARDHRRIREVAGSMAELPLSGRGPAAARRLVQAALDVFEGDTASAVAGFRFGINEFIELDAAFDAATLAISALELLPDEPEIRALAETCRPMLVDLRARPWLERLDAALAVSSPAVAAIGQAVEIRAEQPQAPAERA